MTTGDLLPRLQIADFSRAGGTGAAFAATQGLLPELAGRRRRAPPAPPRTGLVCTPGYVPPEVLAFHAEARHATARCSYGCSLDVWSFGATLWEVVALDKFVPKAFVVSAEREAAALRQRLGRPRRP